MVQGINTAAAGMISILQQNDIIANNMANVNSTGFKQLIPTFKNLEEADVYRKNPDGTTGMDLQKIGKLSIGSVLDAAQLDFTQGNLTQTSRSLDFAIDGEGFFVIEGNEGEELYTRNGNFAINDEGELVTMSGNRVFGENGPIKFELELTDISKLIVGADGRIMLGELEINKLMVVDFEDKSKLAMMGNSLFRNTDPDIAPVEPERVSVAQGFLESSNSNMIKSMIDSITGARTYETLSKIIKDTEGTVKKSVNEVGIVQG